MTATVPSLLVFLIHQAEISLVDQHRRLNRLAGFFQRQFRCRQLAEFLIDERQELIGCRRITLLDSCQNSRNIVGHRVILCRAEPECMPQAHPWAINTHAASAR